MEPKNRDQSRWRRGEDRLVLANTPEVSDVAVRAAGGGQAGVDAGEGRSRRPLEASAQTNSSRMVPGLSFGFRVSGSGSDSGSGIRGFGFALGFVWGCTLDRRDGRRRTASAFVAFLAKRLLCQGWGRKIEMHTAAVVSYQHLNSKVSYNTRQDGIPSLWPFQLYHRESPQLFSPTPKAAPCRSGPARRDLPADPSKHGSISGVPECRR